MKIFILSDGSSIHTRKWVNSLIERGLTIHLFSLRNFDRSDYPENNFSFTAFDVQKRNSFLGGLGKINYLKVLPALKQEIRKFAPDIVHAHFASSYGLLGALSGFHPFIVSVWGSDIFDFPQRSFLYREIIKFNLKKADKILSTSKIMAIETRKFTNKEVEITPFGIDLKKFYKKSAVETKNTFEINEKDIVIGTIKLLELKYGVNFLIHAFAEIAHKYPEKPLKLFIVGDGSEMASLKDLSLSLRIAEKVVFSGMIAHNLVPDYLNLFDVFAALSIEESFGVAIVEAQACEIPVVVSDAGGLPEVVEDGITGFVVKRKNAIEAAKALEKLVLNEELRIKMGTEGRKRVEKLYNWDNNVEQMIEIYEQIKSGGKI